MQELGSILLPQNLWLDTNGALLLGDATTNRPRDPSGVPSRGKNIARNVSRIIYDFRPETGPIDYRDIIRPVNPYGLPRFESPNETLFALFGIPWPCHRPHRALSGIGSSTQARRHSIQYQRPELQ
ncbi:hypothetical protein BS47DRAFT_513623 [Hydnum rufescens UP504]|uniref:Uncharacterized protein n=1 Tax=Hydnum rufescens UP504 TaxID=1448309 RepID=A0A9P6AH12_9AGAM|nr:hypothetical protein BS47DRAFT_513623 [Hydnum rufescens UP504]